MFRDVSSAEEGGGVVLDPAADGKTMMVHLDDGQVMVKRANRGRKISVKFGADDRVFLLRRTDAKALRIRQGCRDDARTRRARKR